LPLWLHHKVEEKEKSLIIIIIIIINVHQSVHHPSINPSSSGFTNKDG
jgi:hypothetical protein